MASRFVHLHVRSMYSLHDALGDVDEIVDRAKELGMDAVALTDRAGMYGIVEFYEAATKAGIKPILGVEVNVAKGKLTDKRARVDDQSYALTLLAETKEGYQNLLKLVSQAFIEGFYYTARTDKEALRTFGKGIIALSGTLRGEVSKLLLSHDEEGAERVLREYRDIFGENNFFVELLHHPDSPTQVEANEKLLALARRVGAPVVATREVLYLSPDDREAQDVLQCIHDGKLLTDVNRFSVANIDHAMCSPEEIEAAFADVPEAVLNARAIADRCTVELTLGKNLLPTFDVPEGETPDGVLCRLCEEGLRERYPAGIPPEAAERLAFELATIERMGFATYFLIVQDYVNWAKAHGVIVGPGRGSAAGSIVAYALKITNLDPLRYGLLFERFLNPDRISMPDIDMDFDDVRRKDVIAYVTEKYGADRVAGIITFGTMAARAAVRDVGRVLGLSYPEVDRIAKVIPPPVQGKHIPLEKSKAEDPELRALYEGDPRVRRTIDLAIRIEGTTRHASQHACGIVIGAEPLVRHAPLQKAQGGDVEQVVQYSLHSTEAVGLLKMDFLGLSNLTIIRECLEIVEAVHGAHIDVDAIPLDDEKTYTLFGDAETTGVFQLESDGMKRYIKELKPSRIEDIIAMVALYRPGPMQFIDAFIRRKHGKERIAYAHPLLENALANTYGIPVYQEQVMQVSKDMAGFTGGEADTLRKAMGKKIAKLMAEMREKFIAGSVKNGVEKPIAEQIFQQFEEFAAYGFNKSHAACYALIAYETAYLKAHYPECFMAALMNSDIGNIERITIEVEECGRMGIDVLPPNVNESFAGFGVVKETLGRTDVRPTIRFGLHAVKGLGEDVAEAIVKERKAGGAFADISDFLSRVAGKVINRKSLEVLIKSGALDAFGERGALLFNIEALLEFHRRVEAEAASGQSSLFAGAAVNLARTVALKPSAPASRQDILAWERQHLGLFLSEHPFAAVAERIGAAFTPVAELPKFKKAKSVRCGGVLTEAKKIYTKSGEPMVFAKLEDRSGAVEAVVFPRVLKDAGELIAVDKVLSVTGRPQEKEGEMKLLVETCFELTPSAVEQIERELAQGNGSSNDAAIGGETGKGNGEWGMADGKISPIPNPQPPNPHSPTSVVIHLRAVPSDAVLQRLRACFDAHSGASVVRFRIIEERGVRVVASSARVTFSEAFVKDVEALLGPGTVGVGEG